ncbi:hypothetical protein EDD11_007989 [Mortierella claussenii]|nr:hypothetical protein EDD11_007989 [Mortierella claussenii]
MPTPHPLIRPAEKPAVVIVGAGIGGLTLAMLLERAGIPYQIYDRMVEVKPLGSAHSLGWNVAPMFKQMGIFDEFMAASKVVKSLDTFNENRELEFSISNKPAVEMGGSDCYLITRTALYDLLRRQVPAENIHMGKRVLTVRQNEQGVRVEFADGSIADGDILVGADGAYSGVRQSLYKDLKKKGKLPSTDDGSLPFSCVCLVGTTHTLDTVKYPELLEETCRFGAIVGKDKPYSWYVLAMKNNVYSWTVTQYLDAETSKDNDSFRNSEWGPEAAEAMSKEVRGFPMPGGANNDLTLGDLIDETPFVSKVMLEEKVFDTWFSKRTVLLGDACHKLHPASGAGAILAMQDAVALANWISVLDSTTSTEDIEKVFQEYKDERYPAAASSFASGQALTKVSGTGLKSRIVRFIARNMPHWLSRMAFKPIVAHRPQVSFLPLVKDEGTFPPTSQPSLEKTLAIIEARTHSAESTAAAAL